jgi:small GTP-binding protein
MSQLQDRFILDYEDVQKEVNVIMDYVDELRNDSFIKRIFSKEDREAILRWQNLIEEKMNEEFSLVVIGDFKRGKSTLINSLLGKDLVTTNVTPETVTINRISYDEEQRAEAVLVNGRRLRLELNELSRSELERIMAQLPEPIDYIDIKDNNELLKEITIVDTPGVGDILKAFDQKVVDYMAKADAVIYVVSALSPISETEQMFLNNAILPHSFSRLFVVVNMVDCFDDIEDAVRIKAAITEKVKAVVSNASVFAVSGLDEYCRKNGLKRPNPDMEAFLEANYIELEAAIQSDIVLQKMVIKSERILQTVRQMTNDIEGRIHLIESLLYSSKEELEQLEEKYEQENLDLSRAIKSSTEILHAEIHKYKTQAKEWMNEFLERLKQEIIRLGQTQKTEVLQKHLQFYLADQLKEAVLLCIKEHHGCIENKLNEIAKDYSRNLQDIQVSISKLDTNFHLSDISWTDVDTATFVIDQGLSIMGIGGLNILATAIAGYIRQGRMSKMQQDLIAPILNNYGKVIDDVFSSLDKAYDEVEKNAGELLLQAYRGQLEKSLNAVKQAREISQKEEIKAEEVKGQLEHAMEILTRINQSLEKF